MPKYPKEKEGVDYDSETWNVAKGYATLKILRHLVDLDDLVEPAVR